MRYIRMTVACVLTGVVAIGPDARAQAAPSERDILLELFNATGGAGWKRSGGWRSDSPVCRWEGVVCGFFADSGRVTRLELWDNNLQGIIPGSLAELKDLKVLDLSRNRLTGTLPAELLKRADEHELELHYWGNTISELLTKVAFRRDVFTGSCGPGQQLSFAAEIDGPAGTAVYQSAHCGGYCLRASRPAPPLDDVSRALRRLSFESARTRYDSPGGSTDHTEEVWIATTWGSGHSQIIRRFAGQAPIEIWSAQQLILGLVPTDWAREARRVSCKTLHWPGE